jgi:hypothetical protein
MATYVNDLRLKEIATGDEAGTWGTSTNTNLELIGEALGYGTQDCFASDADATTTVADGASDPARAMYFKVTSSATLTATRTLTIAPNTISRVMLIENATTGSQSITISQGSGSTVTIASGAVKMVYLDGAGAGGAVVEALADLELPTVTVADLTATTADINGGTIDGTVIGGSTPAAITGTTITGTSFVSSGDMTFGDSDKAIFGAGSDLQIYHDGSDSYITHTTGGNFFINDDGAGYLMMKGSDLYFRNPSNVDMLHAQSGGFVKLYHNGVAKLATTATGIDVTGTVTADGLTVDKTATISTSDYYAASTFSGVLKGAATNTKAALLLNSVSSSGQNAFASIHSEPVADFRASLIGTYSADGSGAGYFAINQFLPASSATQERMRIDSSGNVGIGVSTPLGKLHSSSATSGATPSANGNQVVAENSGNAGITIASGATSLGNIFFADSGDNADGYIQYDQSGRSMRFGTATSEAMRIDSSGNVGIGVVPSSWASNTFDALQLGVGIGVGNLTARVDGINAVGFGLNWYYGGGATNTYVASSFATNYVQEAGTHKWLHAASGTAGAALTFTESMRIDSSGKVGIGLSPATQLDVQAGTTASSSFGLRVAAGTNTSDYCARFNNAAGTFLAGIDGSGNVGIGTSSPVASLDVVAGADDRLLVTNSSGDTFLSSVNAANTAYNGLALNGSEVKLFTNASERMRIDSSGNVGIGTSSPSDVLDVFGSILSSGTTQNRSLRLVNNSGTFEISHRADISATIISTSATPLIISSSAELTFGSAGSERARIDSSGNLLVGTTTAIGAGSNTANNFTFSPASGYAWLSVSDSGGVFVQRQNDNSVFTFLRAAATVGSISVTASATAYNTSSDQRLKENITDAPAGNIDDIKVRSFDWKADGSHQDYGMVAQELEAVAPYAVTKGATEDDMWSVDYSKLVPMLIKEIQDLKAEVAALKGAN